MRCFLKESARHSSGEGNSPGIHDGRAGYGERLIPRLASDLDVSDRLLWSIVHVQSVFPILHTRMQNLEWYHLVILASIEDARQRNRFLKRTLRENSSVRDLIRELKEHKVIEKGNFLNQELVEKGYAEQV